MAMTTGTLRTAAGLDHVATLTPDLDRYVDFYHRIFGARGTEDRSTTSASRSNRGGSWMNGANGW